MLVAVTGGSGRLGRYTIEELLAHDYKVRNLDRRPPEKRRCPFVHVDITDFGEVAAALHGCDAIIHLAAIISPHSHPSQVVYANNTLSSYNVLEAAGMLGIRKICLASSVNAIGLSYSASPKFDYLPVDEEHASRAEDSYSLSKWFAEQQADALVRRHGEITVASMRYHGIHEPGTYDPWRNRASADPSRSANDLWAYTDARDAARANRLALEATWTGHHVFFITAKDTTMDVPSLELAWTCHPDVPVKGDLSGFNSFFYCQKAHTLLGWEHEHSWRTPDG